jgi:hypothetical protein
MALVALWGVDRWPNGTAPLRRLAQKKRGPTVYLSIKSPSPATAGFCFFTPKSFGEDISKRHTVSIPRTHMVYGERKKLPECDIFRTLPQLPGGLHERLQTSLMRHVDDTCEQAAAGVARLPNHHSAL